MGQCKSAPRTSYIDFRKVKLRKTKENMRQCKSEHRGFKKAKERTWDSTSLGGKDFKGDYAKEQLRENMGQSESKGRGFKG
jgi:hypothetical protein